MYLTAPLTKEQITLTALIMKFLILTGFLQVMISGEKGYPMRHKSIHWVNVPRYISALTDFALSFFSPKLQNRVSVLN